MTWLKRIGFFILTNLAIMAILSIILMIVEHFFPGLTRASGGIFNTLIIATVLGFGGAIISLFLSRWSAKNMYGIELITSEDLHTRDPKIQLVYETVSRLAQTHGITMPEVGVYESTDPNAFATGATKNSSLVAVSTGLLSAMDSEAVEGVVSHEMAHILNGDMVTMTLLQGVMNTFVIFLARIIGGFLDRAIFKHEGEGHGWGYFISVLVLEMILGLLASIVINAFSRHREYRADLGGAQMVGKQKMIAGLKKLQTLMSVTNQTDDGQVATFKISSKEAFALFSSHPPLEDRIRALEENYQLG